MEKTNPLKIIFLFFLFFAFQWAAQYGSARLASGGAVYFTLLIYGGFFLRSMVWIEILRDMRLISAYSISSLSYLLIPFMSWLFMGESYKSSYAVGGFLILAGVSVFSIGEQQLELKALRTEECA
jgi:drug/metabolite transporter (DMT)-like permease